MFYRHISNVKDFSIFKLIVLLIFIPISAIGSFLITKSLILAGEIGADQETITKTFIITITIAMFLFGFLSYVFLFWLRPWASIVWIILIILCAILGPEMEGVEEIGFWAWPQTYALQSFYILCVYVNASWMLIIAFTIIFWIIKVIFKFIMFLFRREPLEVVVVDRNK